LKLQEIQRTESRIPASSDEFASQQRQLFRTLEKCLDAGYGACPLRQPAAANIVVAELEALADWQIAAPHFSVMPNHWHALLVPTDARAHSLSQIMKRVKGRTGKRIRRLVPGVGAFWQSEWFDRWVRDDNEWARIATYIQNNPGKAGLCLDHREHPWTR
jgi:REP element-mobilizing transposase RayT